MLVVVENCKTMSRIKHKLKRPRCVNAKTENRATEKNMQLVVLPVEVLLIVVQLAAAGIVKLPPALN